MIKLKTGVSTSLDFVKAMKERGQDVSPAFPAETLRDQLDALSDEVKVTFNSDNETILQVVNDYEPGPVPPTPTEKAILTIVPEEGAHIDSVVSLSIEVDKDTTFDLEGWYTENTAHIQPPQDKPEHYFTPVQHNETLSTTTVVMDSNKTMYLEFKAAAPTLQDWDGEHPESVDALYFKNSVDFTGDQNYAAFRAALEDFGHDDSIYLFDIMQDGTKVDSLVCKAEWFTQGIELSIFTNAHPENVIVSWHEDCVGLFVRENGSATNFTPEIDQVIVCNQEAGGSVPGINDVFMATVQILI